jgi:beta-phosphoglucomutase
MLDAVIFDFDGVIANTEPLHFRAFERTLAEEGLPIDWNAYLTRYIGYDDRDAVRHMLVDAGRDPTMEEQRRLCERKARHFIDIVSTEPMTPFPGVPELLAALHGRIPVALCSGAIPGDIDPVLDRTGLSAFFDARVTAADVAASKPDPASYVLAVRRLSERFQDRPILPVRCVAIEDTAAGIAAATGAGLRVLAVLNTHEADVLHGATHIVPSLAGVTVGMLEALLG